MKNEALVESPTQPWEATYASVGIDPVLAAPNHRSLAEMVHERCQHYANAKVRHPAFSCVMPNGMNGRLGFAAVDEMSDAFAGYLRQTLGLNPGDRVAVQMPNCLAYPVVAFGVMKAGCVLVNTNPLYTASEMRHQFTDAGVKALVVIDLFADKLPEVIDATEIEHVVLTRIDEFFPTIPSWVIRGVQKWWNRVLPPVTIKHVGLSDAIQQGRATLDAHPVDAYWRDIKHSELAVLQYTGGTTGVSKGAMLTHGNLLNNINQMLAMGATHMADGKECVLTALPLYHVFAFTSNLLGFLAIGAHNVLVPSPRPVQNLQRAIENHPISWMTGVNTLYNGLLNEEWFVAYPPRHLKAAIAGGTALHSAVAKRWTEVTDTPIVEGYGLTETSPIVSFNPLRGEPRIGSIGIPAPGTKVKLLDDNGKPAILGEPGEICVHGPQVMQGYWQNDAETLAVLSDGWFATGDVGVMSPDGYMRIVDRKKDLVLVSGFNVYPNEVEDVITRLDGVLEAAVIGVSNAKTGEEVRAYVVLDTDSASRLSQADILAHCSQHLTAYKVPRVVTLRDSLPKSPVGKVLRKELKAEFTANAAQQEAVQ